MFEKIGAVILAAGAGTRLNVDIAKPLLPLLSKALVEYPIESVLKFASTASMDVYPCAVVGHKREELCSHLDNLDYKNLTYAVQKVQNGTGGALKAYFEEIHSARECEFTLVMCADTPLIRASELERLFSLMKNKNLDAVAATFKSSKPFGYGRIVRSEVGFEIVEEKDASADIKLINEVNAGLYIMRTDYVLKYLNSIDSNNAAGEFYLTDLFKKDRAVEALVFEESDSFLGVNTLVQLAQVEAIKRKRINDKYMLSGVFIENPQTVSIDPSVEIEREVRIEAGVIIKGNSVIKTGAHIKAHSYIESSIVRENASVGPFAHLRPGADLGENVKVGNFVEIKKAVLKKGAKVSHLSYVGDAEIGEDSNIGCGFITCNYDGAKKHKTQIGHGCFIGSDTQMVAPVNVGNDCFVASGSTISSDMPDGSFAISRQKQVTKEGLAKRFIKKK